MAYNKTRHLENAQKFLQQGKMSAAIGEYQQILKQEPNDQVTLMTVGDLFVRQGETFQAIEYFERLAQIFIADGFNTKAIAVYKKIAKLAPEETRPIERLAELYLQQGILSEARPIYMQLAELHQRAGRQPQAIALLRKLLEAEPDNLRVQTRLAELSVAANQPGEAKSAYLAAAEQLHRRGEHAEAVKYADRALKIEASDPSSVLLKAKALAAAGQRASAIALIESLPQVESSGDAAQVLMDLYLEAGESSRACELAAKIFARDSKKFAPAHRVAERLLETGEAARALTLLDLIREAMTDAGEHDALAESLARAAEKLPGSLEAREWLVDLYSRASDSFRLPDALASLAEACEAAGKHDRAREVFEQLRERYPENEAIRRKYQRAATRIGLAEEHNSPAPPPPVPAPAVAPPETQPEPLVQQVEHSESSQQEANEPPLDPDTQQFVTQALTDADLFSSYGLTQKSIDLLEIVLQRAPEHAPALERLFDLYLGLGDEQRTAELAARLHEIHVRRGNSAAADRFAELGRRFQRAAELSAQEAAPAGTAAEFPVPVAGTEAPSETVPEPVLAAVPAPDAQASSPGAEVGVAESSEVPESVPEASVSEVDLSEEWAALSGQLTHARPPAESEAAPAAAVSESSAAAQESHIGAAPETVPGAPAESSPEPSLDISEFQVAQDVPEAPPASEPQQPVAAGQILAQETHEPEPVAAGHASGESAQPPAAAKVEAPEYVLELEPAPSEAAAAPAPMKTSDFLRSLSSELEAELAALDLPEPAPVAAAPSEAGSVAPEPLAAGEPLAPEPSASLQPETPGGDAQPSPVPLRSPLGEVFDEFRAEMGETSDQEDLETHYNLGIAYREMGLVEEAISEFQKVAKGSLNGQPFRYAMQCHTLLGLAFMEKGQPAIAAMWYQRALQTPGLDQETILALRYDLGVAQEMAGDLPAARKSFSEVYGMNIDYRDVADRLASLGKG